jgi:ribose-phosphate pyrophosphokinase
MKSIIFSLDNRPKLLKDVIKFFNKNSTSDEILIPGKIDVNKFSDGEVNAQFIDSVRGKRVYLLCSPMNSDLLMVLNLAIDAAKRASAKEIVPIIPYFPYGRQDKKEIRGPIGAKVIAEMLENRGSTTVVLFDLHADQIQGFFNIPVTHMEGKFLFSNYVSKLIKKLKGNVILCSPDAGGVKRVKYLKDRITNKYDQPIHYVTIDKTRKEANVVDEMVLIGDVTDKHVIIVDDMVDTAGTLCKAAKHIMDGGAASVRAIATHGVLSGKAFERLNESVLEELIISDSIDLPDLVYIGDGKKTESKSLVKVVSMADQISRAIIGINNNKSVEALKDK